MISRRITSADLVEVTGFSRHRLRSLMKDLPGYSEKQGIARVAREYSRQDLAVIASCCELEDHYGLRREAIALLVPELLRVFGAPRSIAIDPILIVIPNPPSAEYIDGPANIREGTVLPLKTILDRVDAYLLGDQFVEFDGQHNLDFGPVPVIVEHSSQKLNINHQISGFKNAAG